MTDNKRDKSNASPIPNKKDILISILRKDTARWIKNIRKIVRAGRLEE